MGGVLVALIARFVLATRIETPWIMIDELLYSELAKSFADSGDFVIRDGPRLVNSVGYPALIAPAWFAQSVETSYELARAINVLMMVLAAVPVYLWGRRMMSPAYAALASGLVLLMPSLIYTGMLMTENAFFAAFVATTYAMALTLERPTLLRQALVLIGIAVTCVVRVQALVLVPIYAVALALKLALDLRAPGGPRGVRQVLGELRRYLPSAVVLVVVGGGYFTMKLLQGAPLEDVLAGYGGVVKVEYDVSSAIEWTIDHFAELTLSVAVIPVSALIVLLGLGLRGMGDEPGRAGPPCRRHVGDRAHRRRGGCLRVAIRAADRGAEHVLRRAAALPRVQPVARSGAATAARPHRGRRSGPGCPSAHAAAREAAQHRSPLRHLRPHPSVSARVPRPDLGVDSVRMLMLAGGALGALAFALLPRRLARVALPSGVALFLVLVSLAVFDSVKDHSRATKLQTGATDPSWIDAEIGTDGEAAALYGATNDLIGEAQVLWQTEFWNRSVGTVYRLGPPEPTPISEGVASYDRLTGRITTEPLERARYAVAPRSMQLAGTLLADTPRLALYRVQQPLRAFALLEGVYADGWMVNEASFTRYATGAERPEVLRVRVSRESWNGPSRPGPCRGPRRPARVAKRRAGTRLGDLFSHLDGEKRSRPYPRPSDAKTAFPCRNPYGVDFLPSRRRRPRHPPARGAGGYPGRLLSGGI